AEYAGSSANLAPDHPDIVMMKQEIKALEKETGQTPEVEEAARQLIKAKAELATAAKRLGNDHPDVVKSRRTIQALEQEVKRFAPPALRKPMLRQKTPSYTNTQPQLNPTPSSLEPPKTSRKSVKERLKEYTARLERTPEMEPDYLALTRDRDTSGQKYQDLRSRLLEAKVSEGLEVQRKGERFSLIDPPSLPEKPDKPNRPAIVLLGFILALAAGIGS